MTDAIDATSPFPRGRTHAVPAASSGTPAGKPPALLPVPVPRVHLAEADARRAVIAAGLARAVAAWEAMAARTTWEIVRRPRAAWAEYWAVHAELGRLAAGLRAADAEARPIHEALAAARSLDEMYREIERFRAEFPPRG